MKKTIIISLLLVLTIGLKAQVVYSPNVAIRPMVSMSVYKVEMKKDETVITVRVANENQLPPFSIKSKNLIIRKSGEPDVFKLIKSEKAPFAPERHVFSFKNEVLEFTLHFPPLPQPVKYFDLQEEGLDKQFYLQGIIVDQALNREITRGNRAFIAGDANTALEAFVNVAEMDMYFEFGLAYFNIIYLLTQQKRWAEAGEWYKKFKERFFYDKKLFNNQFAEMGIINRLEAGR